jgi:hypothetical protein
MDLYGKSVGDILLANVRIVNVYYIKGSQEEYLVHKDEVDRLVEATKKLHHLPGINPHNKGETAKIYRIDVSEPRLFGPYWWSTPNLQANEDPSGARIIQGGMRTTAFFLDPEPMEETEKYPPQPIRPTYDGNIGSQRRIKKL